MQNKYSHTHTDTISTLTDVNELECKGLSYVERSLLKAALNNLMVDHCFCVFEMNVTSREEQHQN